MTPAKGGGSGAGYDPIANAYADRYADELQHKPLDRALLGVLAEEVGHGAVVGDVGCGPGHITHHLHRLGLRAVGIDSSPGMIEVARRRFPGPEFITGSMLQLPVGDATWDGLIAFYSIIHLAEQELACALAEFRRVLRDGAPLLLSFHVGDEIRHVDELYGAEVSLDFHFLQPSVLGRRLEAERFAVEMSLERRPYRAVEAETQRGYLLARAV